MTAKAKPLLHLVSGDGDPELFNTDLDWFFNCYDSECGLKCSQADIASQQLNLTGYQKNRVGAANDPNDDEPLEVHAKKPLHVRQENLPYTDRHATFKSNDKVANPDNCVFTRGRRVWQKLSRIPWAQQEDLRQLYEPRRERRSIPEHRVRAAHKAYREAEAA